MTGVAALREQAVSRYATFFTELSPARLHLLNRYCTDDIRFEDPFNRLCGVDALEDLFRHMFENTSAPVFEVHDWSVSPAAGYIFWRFSCRVRGRDVAFDGVSRLLISDDGRIAAHTDYWDTTAVLWSRVPLLGGLLRRLARRLQVPGAQSPW
ncbi:nuclear transport factor 2 family protein [Granulosicoccaceae sp. 1_MG-2023]|nr:nuclear transport factor 2 family protein [Granulosicoccaceae sp. 1_MG-2023]